MPFNKIEINKELAAAILSAVDVCTHPTEEEGGIILMRGIDDPPVLYFIPVGNNYRGTEKAAERYLLDQDDMKKLIYPKVNKELNPGDNWQFYASFHTHPTSLPIPSFLDFHTLFFSFERNVIYATKSKTFSYTVWVDEHAPGLPSTRIPLTKNISLEELQQISYAV